MDMRKCNNCAHHNHDGDSETTPLVECRRYPPIITDVEMFESSFPWVGKDDWCGEFKSVK